MIFFRHGFHGFQCNNYAEHATNPCLKEQKKGYFHTLNY